MTNSTQTGDRPAARFGAFGGVFTPCTLTILGVIMFLRFGEVVGNAGVWHGVIIVLLAKVITTLTALSLSAIATNTRVRGGGAYFLISRSLGVEFGGSIGVVFFLAQATSVAMYVIGFTEVLVAAFPATEISPLLVATKPRTEPTFVLSSLQLDRPSLRQQIDQTKPDIVTTIAILSPGVA